MGWGEHLMLNPNLKQMMRPEFMLRACNRAGCQQRKAAKWRRNALGEGAGSAT